jgi:phosphoribosylformimino-5-aminoimidazole carboxamide ribotide isomerase
MQIIPVLDLLNGVVVRGVAGRRETYRPVESQICGSAEPLTVARAFRDQFGLDRLYVADLDAILHHRPNIETYQQLANDGLSLLVDAGINDLTSATTVLEAGADSIIVGLESLPHFEFLGSLIGHCSAQKVVFSLDLMQGKPLVRNLDWLNLAPLQIAQLALEQGTTRLIVLDLVQVGVGTGVSTLELCAAIRAKSPKIELITGGGVRNRGDLQLLASQQLDGVLVASALHNGRLSRGDLDSLSG